MPTQLYTETLTVLTCCHKQCGVTFAFTKSFERRRRDDHGWFYCPNGHQQHYSQDNEEERLKKELAAAQRRSNSLASDLRWEAARTREFKRSAAAHKGHATRIRNLIAKGICPVPGCRRNFTNVKQHMSTQHPDWHQHEETP